MFTLRFLPQGLLIYFILVITLLLWLTTIDAFIAPSQTYTSSQFIFNSNSFPVLMPSAIEARCAWHHTRIFKTKDHRKFFMTLPENQDESTTGTSTTDRFERATTTTETSIPSNMNNLYELSPTEFILATENMDPTTRSVVEAAKKKQQQQQQQLAANGNGGDTAENKYPIDLPSPVLLATSMILAIISTGTCSFHTSFLASVAFDFTTIIMCIISSRKSFYICTFGRFTISII